MRGSSSNTAPAIKVENFQFSLICWLLFAVWVCGWGIIDQALKPT
jgi:hypothetical protein